MNTIESKYLEFESNIIDQPVPEQQRREMRLVFFVGAFELLNLQLKVLYKGYSEEATSAILQGLYDECKTFFSSYGEED
jgi:hypothetical protein